MVMGRSSLGTGGVLTEVYCYRNQWRSHRQGTYASSFFCSYPLVPALPVPQSKLDLHALHDAEPRRACRLASSRTRCTAHVRALAPALPVVVAPLRAQFRVSHLRQLLVEVAVAVSRHDALEELRRRYAWGAARGDEFAWGNEVSNACGWSPPRGDAGKKYICVSEEIGTVPLRVDICAVEHVNGTPSCQKTGRAIYAQKICGWQ